MEQISGSAGVPDHGQSTTPPDNRTSPVLSAAITALKQHRYEEAIAQFEQICQTATDEPTRLKAQMGLVKAYERTGNVQWAIALCQPLRESPSSQVRQWATQTLGALEFSSRISTPEDSSLNVPTLVGNLAGDETGFIPLDPEAVDSFFETPDQSEEASSVPLGVTPEAAYVEESNPFDGPLSDPFGTDQVEEVPITQPPQIAAEIEWEQSSTFTAPPDDDEVEMQTAELPASALVIHYPQWRHAPRATHWASLGRVDPTKLWGAQLVTAIATVWLSTAIVRAMLGLWNYTLSTLTWPLDLRGLRNYSDPFWLVTLICIVLLCATPWLMDWVLRYDRARPMPLDTLRRASPESVNLLRKVCNTQRWPLPDLWILSTDVPLVMSYGHLPQFTRLVISQGVLNRLPDDEIAALIAAELGHLRHWAIALPSAITLLGQGPYLLYRIISRWGNRQPNQALQTLAVIGSSLAYGLYRLLRLPGLWLSRLRASYGDRAASELAGNPNGLSRALLRLNLIIAETVERRRQTHPLLESMSLLLPVDIRSAVPLGSLLQRHPTEPLLLWDCVNPHRQWLSLNSPLPSLGDRLKLLELYARHWQLEPELELEPMVRTAPRPRPRTTDFWGQQAAPYLGVGVGLAVGLLLWGVGAIAEQALWPSLSWMWRNQSLLRACTLLGFSIGMLLRINPFYPDIKRSSLKTDLEMVNLFQDPTALPVDGQSIQIQGTLIGRKGLANGIAQDLFLQSPAGLIRLHLTSQIGPLGQLLPPFQRYLSWIGTPVTVVGWYRRGLTPWIDVSTLQPQRGTALQSAHPQFSTLAMAIAAVAGIYLILRGA